MSSNWVNSRAYSGLTAVYFDCRCEVLLVCVMMHIFSNHLENLSEDSEVKTLLEVCTHNLK